MKKVVVKIDICGSKGWCETNRLKYDDPRATLVEKLIETCKCIFPESDRYYPDGSLYKVEGDSIYFLLDKPTVGLRAAINFARTWAGMIPTLPDSRVVIDYGDISDVEAAGKKEVLGVPFENISKIEKDFREGEIGVTENFVKHVDETVVQFISRGIVRVSDQREIAINIANYENPRLLNDSTIVHALFIANPTATEVRIKSFEALLLEFLYKSQKVQPLKEINRWLDEHDCPTINSTILKDVVDRSEYLEIDQVGNVRSKETIHSKIDEIKSHFESAKKYANQNIKDKLAAAVGLEYTNIEEKLDIHRLIEEYLCAIFLEIRMMANYFRSTGMLFERLTSISEFDYIIHKNVRGIIGDSIEKFIFFKKAFLESLRELALIDNAYVASIFHNVLILYYLNRNAKYAQSQLNSLQGKELYLDTNTFYSLSCPGSGYHEILTYTLGKLVKMKIVIRMFDKSIDEYNESLDNTLRNYRYHKGVGFVTSNAPWIWEHFQKNRSAYNNDFEYCIRVHMLPQRTAVNDEERVKLITDELKSKNIELKKMDPFLNKHQLGDLFEWVYEVKRKFDPTTEWYVPTGSPSGYEARVLHDANCLRA